jgi:hypothetical protein
MDKINWTTYLATNNLEGVNRVLYKYGYLPAFDVTEAEDAIEILQQEHGTNATIDLIKEHPDYDVIIDTHGQNFNFSNAAGDVEIEKAKIQLPPEAFSQPQIVPNVPNMGGCFSSTFQNIVLVVMAFWLINKIISKNG